jgi:hypothetical protein
VKELPMRLPVLTFALLAAAPATAQVAPGTPTVAPVRAKDILSRPPPATTVAEPVAMMIAACDANGDAVVTRDELARCVERSFGSVDTDHKGSIGYIAFSDWSLMWLGDRNALPGPFETDADSDNHITVAELQAKLDSVFTRLDTDKDGKLTRAELLTIRSGLAPEEQGRGKHRR